MKKMMILFAVTITAGCALAWPCGPCGPGWCGPGWGGPRWCGPGFGPCPPGGFWGRGGCNFWPGFVGGMVGGVLTSALASPPPPPRVVVQQPVVTTPIVTTPIVVQQPVVVSQPAVTVAPVTPVRTTQESVWIEGRYIDRTQSNGTVVREWNPGHYETRTVLCR